MSHLGDEIYSWAQDLYPICRSITGDGTRKTLCYLAKILPELVIHEVPSGTPAFDWTVPDEWNIRDAYVRDASGNWIIDFQRHNLHVVGYSEPVDQKMTFSELDNYLYSLPDQPTAIPYVTSYYTRRWGFCLTEEQRNHLRQKPDEVYHVKIDSTLTPGNLNYGELIIPGKTDAEILISTYVCHPSMANNELSGPCVVAALARWISRIPNRNYTYRILFLPETIGSITYLSLHKEEMKQKTKAGFVVSCVGDNKAYSYLKSRTGGTLADHVMKHVLSHQVDDFVTYPFLERGSDERQYCSPGIDLPVCLFCRTKFAEYDEYHTSLDDMDLINPDGLNGAFHVLSEAVRVLEANKTYVCTVDCEPQLGKRGLYPTVSTKESTQSVYDMMNLIAYVDGKLSLLEIAEIIGAYAGDLIPYVQKMTEADLFQEV